MSKSKSGNYNIISEIVHVEGNIKVVLGWIGEGKSGDFDPNDPTDIPLLRFDIYTHHSLNYPFSENNGKKWHPVNDASYCTCLIADNKQVAKDASKTIMKMVKGPILSNLPIKKVCEELSRLSTADFIGKKPLTTL